MDQLSRAEQLEQKRSYWRQHIDSWQETGLMYTTDSSRFVNWHGTIYLTLADFQAATNQELNGIANELVLSDSVGSDFAPTRHSPLVDRGELLPGIDDVFSGRRPDIGAREYSSVMIPSVPTLLLDD